MSNTLNPKTYEQTATLYRFVAIPASAATQPLWGVRETGYHTFFLRPNLLELSQWRWVHVEDRGGIALD